MLCFSRRSIQAALHGGIHKQRAIDGGTAVANSSQHHEESSLNLAASNAPIYERRQRERREPRLSLDEHVASAAENINATDKLYRYSILSGPLPVADYVAEIHVKDNGDATSTVEWSSDFKPKDATEGDAVKAIQGVYQAGFDNLKKMFGG
jgi:hypothetical protein